MSENCILCRVNKSTGSDQTCDSCRNHQARVCDGCESVCSYEDMYNTEDGQLLCPGCWGAAHEASEREGGK